MMARGSRGQLALDTASQTSHRRKLIRLALLAPDIQRAILAGEHKDQLTLAMLMENDIPLSWARQRRMFDAVRTGSGRRRSS
jgi:hypothetical protein